MSRLDTQVRSIVCEAAENHAAQFLSEGGTLATKGDWDAEAWSFFKERNEALLDASADWDDAWELYLERFNARLSPAWGLSGAAARRAFVCPTCGAEAGQPCPGTRDHNSRYKLAGQDAPPSGPSGDHRARREPDGLFLTGETIAADLSLVLARATRGRALSYPEACDTPERRAAHLRTEVEALLAGFQEAAQRVGLAAVE